MGVPAVNVMQHASFARDGLHAANDRLRNAQPKPSVRPSSLKLPWSPRRLRLARLTGPVAFRRPASVSDPVASSSCKPFAANLLSSSYSTAAGAAPASGMEPLPFMDPARTGLSSCELDTEDPGIDYREAAAALELLFSESPSLDVDRCSEAEADAKDLPLLSRSSPSSAAGPLRRPSPLQGLKRKDRKDLAERIILHRKRLGDSRDQNSRKGGKSAHAAAAEFSSFIWSPAASELVRQYGEVVNLTAQNWSRLGGELLTAEEERWLGSLMKPAKDLMVPKEILKQNLGREPSNEEWAQAGKMDLATLTRHLALHQAARNKLVKTNLRLVKHQARKYAREAVGSSLTVVELCQEGVKGLITAIDRFDPAKGVRFSTYAVFWIRNSVVRAQTRSGYPIRAPFNFAELKMSINKARQEMRLESGEESSRKILEKALEQTGVDKEKYKTLMRSTPRVVSLHQKDSLTGAELVERLADARSHHDANAKYIVGSDNGNSGIEACDPLLRLGIDDVLDSLHPKESLVLRQRFGLDGEGERSLAEIGRNMCISREMARRYETRGLLKLQHPTRLAYLRSYLSQD